jgi:hypothetical protein
MTPVLYEFWVFWSARKLKAAGASAAEKPDLPGGAASRFYRLDL